MIELGTQYNGRTDGPKEREQEKAATVWLPHEYSSRRTTHENNVTDNTVKKRKKEENNTRQEQQPQEKSNEPKLSKGCWFRFETARFSLDGSLVETLVATAGYCKRRRLTSTQPGSAF